MNREFRVLFFLLISMHGTYVSPLSAFANEDSVKIQQSFSKSSALAQDFSEQFQARQLRQANYTLSTILAQKAEPDQFPKYGAKYDETSVALMDVEDVLVDFAINGNAQDREEALLYLGKIDRKLEQTRSLRWQSARLQLLLARVWNLREHMPLSCRYYEKYLCAVDQADGKFLSFTRVCAEYFAVVVDEKKSKLPLPLRSRVFSAAKFRHIPPGGCFLPPAKTFEELESEYKSLRIYSPEYWKTLDILNQLIARAGDYKKPVEKLADLSKIQPLLLEEEEDITLHRPDLAVFYDAKALQLKLFQQQQQEDDDLAIHFLRVINRYIELGDIRRAEYWLKRLSMQKLAIKTQKLRLKLLSSMQNIYPAAAEAKEILDLQDFKQITQDVYSEPILLSDNSDLDCMKVIENVYRSAGNYSEVEQLEARRLKRWWLKIQGKEPILFQFVGSDFTAGTFSLLDSAEKIFAGATDKSPYDERFRSLTGISNVCQHCYLLSARDRNAVAERILRIAGRSAKSGEKNTFFWAASSAAGIYQATNPVLIANQTMDVIEQLDATSFRKESEMLIKQVRERLSEVSADSAEKKTVLERITKFVGDEK